MNISKLAHAGENKTLESGLDTFRHKEIASSKLSVVNLLKSLSSSNIKFLSSVFDYRDLIFLYDIGCRKIKIPSGTQHGRQFRLKGKGMPVLRRNLFGDLYIRINTQVPNSLSKRQKEILEEFGEIEKNKPDPIIKNFFEKAKKFWRSS